LSESLRSRGPGVACGLARRIMHFVEWLTLAGLLAKSLLSFKWLGFELHRVARARLFRVVVSRASSPLYLESCVSIETIGVLTLDVTMLVAARLANGCLGVTVLLVTNTVSRRQATDLLVSCFSVSLGSASGQVLCIRDHRLTDDWRRCIQRHVSLRFGDRYRNTFSCRRRELRRSDDWRHDALHRDKGKGVPQHTYGDARGERRYSSYSFTT
jgi:hypothetical protein